jgi:hypothetical protein
MLLERWLAVTGGEALIETQPASRPEQQLVDAFVIQWHLPRAEGVRDDLWSCWSAWSALEPAERGSSPSLLGVGMRTWKGRVEGTRGLIYPARDLPATIRYDALDSADWKQCVDDLVARFRASLDTQAAAYDAVAHERGFRAAGPRHRGASGAITLREGAQRLYWAAALSLGPREIARRESPGADVESRRWAIAQAVVEWADDLDVKLPASWAGARRRYQRHHPR